MSLINIESQNSQQVRDIITNKIGKENLDKINNIFKNGFKHDKLKIKSENMTLSGLDMLCLKFTYLEDNILIEGHFNKTNSVLTTLDKSINLYVCNDNKPETRLIRIYTSSFENQKGPKKNAETNVFDIYDEEFDIRLNETDFIAFAEENILKIPFSTNVSESLLMFFFNMEELAKNCSFENINEGYVKLNKDYLTIKFLISDSFYVPSLSNRLNKNQNKNKNV